MGRGTPPGGGPATHEVWGRQTGRGVQTAWVVSNGDGVRAKSKYNINYNKTKYICK